MPNEVTVTARGKVNLSLNITGVQNGMHLLDSVTAAVDVYDTVTVRFDDSGEVRVRFVPLGGSESFAPFDPKEIGENNTVKKAVLFLQTLFPHLGASVTVQKGIPLAGGLGGSSADAAAILRAALKVVPHSWNESDVIKQSVAIGSDVPVLLCGGGVHMQGVGETLTEIKAMPTLHLAIAHGSKGVLSKDAYKTFDAMYALKQFCPTDTNALIKALLSGDVQQIAPHLHNALEQPARSLCAEIDATLSAVRATGAVATFMTGSGNCCCGHFSCAADAQAAAKALRQQGFMATATHTIG